MLHGQDSTLAAREENGMEAENGAQWVLGKPYVIVMSARLGCVEQSASSQGREDSLEEEGKKKKQPQKM